ncbi:MAG: Leucine--tRNA ligase [bacterium ADurb.Bin212]|nr:MAG: Leucine--tRNA ligase [bacterium ADurb.Bin212]
MAKKYNFKQIEAKWQKLWQKEGYGKAEDFSQKPKHYNLIEFPYPSGSGLHVGHCMGFGASDAYCRMKRMQGYNVLYPVGWDAFGLPTENYAIKTGIHPKVATEQNIENFRNQMKALGLSFDFGREVDTTDPDYYKWTQWIFLQFYKHAIVDGKLVEVADNDTTTPRLAYQTEMPINWCPSCKIGLANEEVIGGNCERCGTQTEKRMQKQWMLRITAYADRLIDDLETVDYLPKIKTQQVNWIGRSTGTNIIFKVVGRSGTIKDEQIEVFTTRADTLLGCTYMVVAPEHPIINKLGHHIQNFDEVREYINQAKKKSDLERTEIQKDKTGVKLYGISAINPINGREIDIYVADYVLANYGTGAVMAVPAHDERDYEFAKKYNIPIVNVVMPKVVDKHDPPIEGKETIFRQAIQAIVVNPKNNKVLTLHWKKFPWTTFVTGGIDDGEDPVEAARREIQEETGYKNIKFIRQLGEPVESHFYANHKGVNRKAHFIAMVFELVDEEKCETSADEKAIHDCIWMNWEDLNADKNVKCAEYEIWMDRYFNEEHAYTNYGVLYNSNKFDGLESEDAITKITEKLKELGAGDFAKNYKLRDWIFSRQHYWGEPIPIIHCEKCGSIPMEEKDLPLTLPEVEKYQPTDTGESPLAAISDWVNVKCPKCGGKAKRETDTMPNWAGSSWYFLAYALNQESRIKNHKDGNIFTENKKELQYWMPVDLYNGGMEHTTLHLLYSRFWHKFLFDLGVVPNAEPYAKRIAHGIILGPDNQKMSKSKGNVINPDDIIKEYGADSLRAYIMFIGPYDQESAWNTNGLSGVYRFLNRVWENCQKFSDIEIESDLSVPLNKLIKECGESIENYSLNTYIAKLMEFNNLLSPKKKISKKLLEQYLILLSPACPHIAHELWEKLGNDNALHKAAWPNYDSKKLIEEKITIVVQINGKVRQKLSVSNDVSDEELKQIAIQDHKVKEHLNNKEPKKIIVVPKKLVSIVA